MRKIIVGAAICALLALAVFAVWHYYAAEFIIAQISSSCEKNGISAPVFKGKPEMTLVPPALILEQTEWKQESGDQEMSITAQKGEIEFGLLPLLVGNVQLKKIAVDKPVAILRLNAKTGQKAAAAESGGEAAPVARIPDFEIDRLVIQNGALIYKNSGKVLSLKDIKLSADNLKRRQEADIRCDFILDLNEENTGAQYLSGNLAFKSKLHYYPPNLTFRQASASFTSLTDTLDQTMGQNISPLQISFEGAINLDDYDINVNSGSLAIPQALLKLRGEGNIRKVNFKGQTDLEINLARLSGKDGLASLLLASPINLESKKCSLPALAARMGNMEGGGDILLDFGAPGLPAISGKLNLGVINLENFAGQGARDPSAPAKKQKTSPGALPKVDLKLYCGNLIYKKLSFRKISLHVLGDKGQYQLENLAGQWSGGELQAEAKVGLPQKDWSLAVKGRNIDFGKAMSEFEIDGFEKGKSAFQATLASSGPGIREQENNLTGSGEFEVKNTRFVLLEDITDTLSFFSRKKIDYSGANLKASFAAKAGRIDISPVLAQAKDFQARGQALVNLESDYFDSRLAVKLGGLNIPLYFRGPFGNITIGIDSKGGEY